MEGGPVKLTQEEEIPVETEGAGLPPTLQLHDDVPSKSSSSFGITTATISGSTAEPMSHSHLSESMDSAGTTMGPREPLSQSGLASSKPVTTMMGGSTTPLTSGSSSSTLSKVRPTSMKKRRFETSSLSTGGTTD